jgi:Tol biopolymer transport system component
MRALDGSDALLPNSDNGNVWGINLDGTSATPLTHYTATEALAQHAAFSPDATRVAFQSGGALDGSDNANKPNGSVSQNIWVMNADGTGSKPLTKLTAKLAGANDPAWSPDSANIAFDSDRALDGSDAIISCSPCIVPVNIWVMKADGTGLTHLTSLTGSGVRTMNPLWSPDGTKLAYISNRALDGSDATAASASTFNIWVINADGTNDHHLTSYNASGAEASFLAWSLDGTRIAYASDGALNASDAQTANATFNIWVVNTSGTPVITALTQLDAPNLNSFPPAWSPDNSKIAYRSTRALDGSNTANGANATRNVWVMNSDGSAPAHLTALTSAVNSSLDIEAPLWVKNGAKIVFVSNRALDGSDSTNANKTLNIWVMNADGSSPTPLTKITVSGGDCRHARLHP